jgi:hypothetical protein
MVFLLNCVAQFTRTVNATTTQGNSTLTLPSAMSAQSQGHGESSFGHTQVDAFYSWIPLITISAVISFIIAHIIFNYTALKRLANPFRNREQIQLSLVVTVVDTSPDHNPTISNSDSPVAPESQANSPESSFAVSRAADKASLIVGSSHPTPSDLCVCGDFFNSRNELPVKTLEQLEDGDG